MRIQSDSPQKKERRKDNQIRQKQYNNGVNKEEREDKKYTLLYVSCLFTRLSYFYNPSITRLCSSLSQATTIKKSRELYRHTVKSTGSKQHLYNNFNNGGTTVLLYNMQRNMQVAFERKIACKLKLYNCVYRAI